MKIKKLLLKNWSVIREAAFDQLGDLVVIAGPNGVGKTKVKDAIVYIFQNSGNPPPNCSVILEATSPDEVKAWGEEEVALPQGFWTSFFNTQQKRLNTKSRIIQIDANRNIDTVSFQQLTFGQIGNPEEEAVDFNYGVNNVKNRFTDICRTLHRLKSREVTNVYKEYQKTAQDISENQAISIKKLQDPTEQYKILFDNLLYPKKMMPIDITSSTIQYKDDDGGVRQFSELSSGEREVVILTFDILAQNPSDCLILIDEPEVHLHPELTFRLVKALKSIGNRNQIFLFTHSPDIIGSSFDSGVYFIRPKARISGDQVVRVDTDSIENLKVIPNIRETIGMVSVGKKILFVEGSPTSIDRNVFASLAKEKKINLSIVPSNSCSNINNLSQMSESLGRSLFGLDFCMIRDRDSLNENQIAEYENRSGGKLLFLPYYHIENAFLIPEAIGEIAKVVLLSKAPSVQQIEKILLDLAKNQISYLVTLYVKSEVYFQAEGFDVTPKIQLDKNTKPEDIAKSLIEKRNERVAKYSSQFNDAYLEDRVKYWTKTLTESIQNGWSDDARKFFYGKRLLKEMQSQIFTTKNILIWEHILQGNGPGCLRAKKELEEILEKVG